MELELELEKLMEEAERGKIGRSQLRMMMGRLNERKRELERAMSEAGGILRRLGGRYENVVVEIEEARARIETIRMGIESLRNQYRVGRVSKIVYERLLRDYSRRLEGERAKVRRNLEALKG
jgi:chromosome segregation ATPase